MAHNPTDKAAVDEGRDPYGLPGHGNGGDLWRRFDQLPCPTCGATAKRLVIQDESAEIECFTFVPGPYSDTILVTGN